MDWDDLTVKNGDGNESLAKLQAYADKVDIRKIGLRSTTCYDKLIISYAIAQAIIDCLGVTEQGLVARDFIHEVDFTSPLEITSHVPGFVMISKGLPEWRQPMYGYYLKANEWITVYNDQWNHDINDHNRKVRLIYGYKNLGGRLYSSNLKFMRGRVKTIDIVDLESTKNNKECKLTAPIIYKAGDDMSIDMKTNRHAVGHFDQIQLRGVVVEPLGSTVTG